jgi:hypothetical protein
MRRISHQDLTPTLGRAGSDAPFDAGMGVGECRGAGQPLRPRRMPTAATAAVFRVTTNPYALSVTASGKLAFTAGAKRSGPTTASRLKLTLIEEEKP